MLRLRPPHAKSTARRFSPAVGDELHVLLHCPATQAARAEFADCLQWRDSLPAFLAANVCDQCPEFVHAAMVGYTVAATVDDMEMALQQLHMGLVGRFHRA